MMKLAFALATSLILASHVFITGVVDASGSQLVGAIAGVAGSGVLGTVGVQIMRTYRASNRWQEAQLGRYTEEIKSLRDELTEERKRNRELSTEVFKLRAENSQLRSQLHGQA